MTDKLWAFLESRRSTLLAVAVAAVLYFTGPEASAMLANDFHVHPVWAIRVVSTAKFLLVLMAAAGVTPVPRRTE